eukprot:CAMPEP_0198291618 /NCGR_PEP_ID=MMETSP1449-20131203/9097_1 /TAXON_ID=420275 /ORGANISM="Attheya septentrionalis, Strain CCMP2084" /LENGTH=924 /DNA_ID=CAMNT_0043990287 /DNA_START=97 /DNA_END=2871 /DNA_ORIENTATION=+
MSSEADAFESCHSSQNGGGSEVEQIPLLVSRPLTSLDARGHGRISWAMRLREFRHTPCLMNPASAMLLVVMCGLSLVGMILHLPEMLIGLLMAPVLRRGIWLVEFLYPTGIARWGHFYLLKWSDKSKNKLNPRHGIMESHSRSIEQRTEVIKGRVYIHPIPQLLDNIGYLIVCCPPPEQRLESANPPSTVCVLVDCGDANAALYQLRKINMTHYPGDTLELHAVLCTHKHHDHTAGNKGLLASPKVNQTLKHIYGGVVEKVPYANRFVRNGDIIDLPKVNGNDMNDFIAIEAISVPSHTRGSIVYALHNKQVHVVNYENADVRWDVPSSKPVTYLFTGDTIFSAGGGVPFESDLQTKSDQQETNKRSTTLIKAAAGTNSVERCFAEVLVRAAEQVGNHFADCSRMLIFPGHEYTSELMSRQFQSGENATQWHKMTPAVFFESVSQLYISNHRRTLPKGGRLLTVPSTMTRELKINPHYRSLVKRGEHIRAAIRLWYKHFAQGVMEQKQQEPTIENNNGISPAPSFVTASPAPSFVTASFSMENMIISNSYSSAASDKTPSSHNIWNYNVDDVNRPVFTTVYASDLDSVIRDLQRGVVDNEIAAARLMEMKKKLDEKVVMRRSIPRTLPSDKNIYLGILALALLGSPPCALTTSDSFAMKTRSPVENPDRILISQKRLVTVLQSLGIIFDTKDCNMVGMIRLLWKEARNDDHDLALSSAKLIDNELSKFSATDVESPMKVEQDEVELGLLKYALYGVSMNHPPSWKAKLCLPCGVKPTKLSHPSVPHPIKACAMEQSNGELVRHDIASCPMCKDVVGCPVGDEQCAKHPEPTLAYENNVGGSYRLLSETKAPKAPANLLECDGSSASSEDILLYDERNDSVGSCDDSVGSHFEDEDIELSVMRSISMTDDAGDIPVIERTISAPL